MEFPTNLKYTKDHEWVELGDKVRIGVTEYAIEQLGDIVHVDLPEVGESFEAGASFGTIESTKTVSDLYIPVAGKVAAINDAAVSDPESLQSDPYKAGWLVEIEASSEASDLLDAAGYQQFVSEQD